MQTMSPEIIVTYLNDEGRMRMKRIHRDDASNLVKEILENDYYSEHRAEHPIVLDGDVREMRVVVRREITEVILTHAGN